MNPSRIALTALIFGLLVFSAAFASPRVGAEGNGGGFSFVVNSLADTTGGCSQPSNGTCTIRDAIVFANAAGGGTPFHVTFSVSGFLNLTSKLPNIKYNMTFDGSGQQLTISGQGAYRIFTVGNRASVTIKALTMANGNGDTDCGSSYSCGGAIKNRGTLTVNNSFFSGNYSDFTGGAIFNANGTLSVVNTTFINNSTSQYYGLGGAIYNAGTANIGSNTSFSNNSAFIGGAIYHQIGQMTLDAGSFKGNTGEDGGVIYTIGSLTITNSTFSDNEMVQSATGTYGGAIHNDGGTLNVNNSIFSNNSTSPFGYGGAIASSGSLIVKNSTITGNYAEYGGGIYFLDGSATISKSTLDNNTGWGDGGGIYNDHGTMVITNSTLTANTAEGANGGGIYNFDGALYVTNSTVYGNHSASLIHYAGGIYNDGTSVTLRNTVIANNSENQCYDYADSLVADSYNIDDDGTCGNATQKTVAQIQLLSLASNGGPTQTMKPGAQSVLRNAGDDTVCTDPVGPSDYGAGGKDQRGVTRPQGIHCDVGAYEVKAQ